jgi:hypothetical protein
MARRTRGNLGGVTGCAEEPKVQLRPVPWWVGPLFAICAVGIVPWIVFLAISLPNHATFAHYRGVWVGFDIGLVTVLAFTAYLGWRGRPAVALTAVATATMLFVDAWFDLLTTPRGPELLVAVLTAALFEVPFALLCLWIALHAEQVVESRLRLLSWRAAQANQPEPGARTPAADRSS